MLIIHTFLILIFVGIGYSRYKQNEGNNDVIPWIGVLRVHPGDGKVALTGIILINNNAAVGNSFEVSKIDKTTIRNTTQAQFYDRNNMASFYDVTGYIVHPEHEQTTVNSLALVFLEVEGMKERQPIKLAKNVETRYDSVYNIGYTDDKNVLKQTLYHMEYVKKNECIEFYRKEQIDNKIVWPSHYVCYRTKNAQNPCLFDAGTALVTNHTGAWELVGVGTRGPGCALPARYTRARRYRLWLHRATRGHHATRGQHPPTRGQHPPTRGPHAPRGHPAPARRAGVYSVDYEDFDTYYLGKIDDTSMVLRPGRYKTNEEIGGNCTGADGSLAYRDFNKFDVPTPSIGIYVLSHLDTLFGQFNCILLTVFNSKTSKPKFWLDKGFHQDDIGLFTERIPLKSHGKYPARVLHAAGTWERLRALPTAHLVFRFHVEGTAWFDVKFYASSNVTTVAKFTAPPTARRRPYQTSLRIKEVTTTRAPETTTPATTPTTPTTPTSPPPPGERRKKSSRHTKRFRYL